MKNPDFAIGKKLPLDILVVDDGGVLRVADILLGAA